MRALAVFALVAVAATSAALPASQSIAIRNLAFQYEVVAVDLGRAVTWSNEDREAHTVTSTDCPGGCSFHSGDVEPGTTFAFTPRVGGTIRYECTRHEAMLARLVVQTRDPADPNPRISDADVAVGNDAVGAGSAAVPIPYRYRVDVTVRNPGGSDASGVFVRVEVTTPDGDVVRAGTPAVDVPAGGSAVASAVWDATRRATDHVTAAGTYAVSVALDPENDLVEGEETDNEATGRLVIRAGGLA